MREPIREIAGLGFDAEGLSEYRGMCLELGDGTDTTYTLWISQGKLGEILYTVTGWMRLYVVREATAFIDGYCAGKEEAQA